MKRPPPNALPATEGAEWPPPAAQRHLPRSHRAGASRWLQRAALLLISIGVIATAGAAALLGYGAWQERQLTEQWRQIVSTTAPVVDTAPPALVVGQPGEPPPVTATPPAPIV